MAEIPDDFSNLQPSTFTAIELRGTEPDGRSRPLRMACRTGPRQTGEFIVKLKEPLVGDATPWRLCLARELVGALVARRVGLAVPDFGLVEISDPLIRALQSSPEGARLQENRGLNFGSMVVDNVSVESPAAAPTPMWADTLTFDAFAFNADRSIGNPNILWDGASLIMIDHGHLAPTWTAAVDGLTGDSLYGATNIRLHTSFQHLRSKGASYRPVRDSWVGNVTSSFLRWATEQVPAEWASDAERQELFEFLDNRASIADRQVAELSTATQ